MFNKALAYPCKHIGVIKFLTIHSKPLKGYTLLWNGACFKKCWITTQSIHSIWRIECYYNNQTQIWKGKNDLSPLAKIVWRWHGHSLTSWLHCTIMGFCTMIRGRTTSCYIFYSTNYILCTLLCEIGVKLDACKRWLHL